MVEIKYKGNYEVVDLAGKSVAEARHQFKGEFGIPEKAAAKLNGRKIKEGLESDTCLSDDDRLSFSKASNKGLIMVGALLLALAVTGSVFAYGFVTATTTITASTITSDFASVTANNSGLTWAPFGRFKGTIGAGNLFDVGTYVDGVNGYTGDFGITVSIANGDQLAKVYRVLALKLAVMDVSDNTMVLDASGGQGVEADDYVLLTLGNGAVDMFITQAQEDNYYVKVKSGFYMTHVYPFGGFGATYEDPQLFAEVYQR
ncbi:hypothetical protein ACFLXD_01540 [Chloroflexota bacterium]